MQTNLADFPTAKGAENADEAVAELGPATAPQRLRFIDRHSRFVGWTKATLFAVAIALIGLIVMWPQLRTFNSGFRFGFASIDPQEASRLQMVNARYLSIDGKSRPYTVTAEVATQAVTDKDLVELTSPKADITLQNGSWIALESERGMFHKGSKVLDLVGIVNLFHDSGYELRTERLRANFVDGVAEGNAPVEGQGPFGLMNSEGVRIFDQGRRIIFTGKSRFILHPREQQATP
jgi:lipopolysaccharide export system protein LptC